MKDWKASERSGRSQRTSAFTWKDCAPPYKPPVKTAWRSAKNLPLGPSTQQAVDPLTTQPTHLVASLSGATYPRSLHCLVLN